MEAVLIAAIPELTKLLFGVIAGLATWIWDRNSKREDMKWLQTQAVASLAEAVAEVGDEIVEGLKEASADGKLTKDERKQVQAIAIAKAKDIATGKGFDLIKIYSERALQGMITKIVQDGKFGNDVTVIDATDSDDDEDEGRGF